MPKQQLSEIIVTYQEVTGIKLDLSTARKIGARGLLAQIGDFLGGNDTRCDDCNATGYTGDLLKDFRITLRGE